MKYGPLSSRGVSIVEAIVSIGIFSMIMSVGIFAYLNANRLSELTAHESKAYWLSEEGIEATRSIRDASFASLTSGSYGLALTNATWQFSGTSDYTNGYQRTIALSILDANNVLATSTVAWSERGATTTVALTTLLTNWHKATGTAASHLTLDASASCVYTLDTRYLGNVRVTYDGTQGAISITQVAVSWTPTSQTLNQVLAPYPTTVWTGTTASAATTTLATPVSFTSAGTTTFTFMWNGSVSGKNFTITFILSDGSAKTVTVTSPIISICI